MSRSGWEAIPTDSASSIQNQLWRPARRNASDASTSAQRPPTVSSRMCASAKARVLDRHDAGMSGAGAAAAVVSVSVALAVGGVTLLVVLGVDVDAPDVVMGAQDVLDRQHRGVHRVILVVVPVHAVAAHRIHVGGVILDPGAHDLDLGLVRVV